ncbi:MAG: flagellar export chaperone FliS, partial [Proteobacteria bacterium]|nr:flagellar export chaperone FliS [Pseudomonadota bacterium]
MDTVQKQKYQAYAAATQTVARTKQIVMLYDGTIRFIYQAKEAIEKNNIQDRYNMLTKASEVLLGLQSCLDFENGGQIAKVLYNFYSTIDSMIFQVHRTGSAQTCDTIIAEMKKMRDVWQEIDESTTSAPPPPPTEPGPPKGP